MKLILVGLGKMGGQLVAKFTAADHQVIVLDPNQSAVAEAITKGGRAGVDRASALAQIGAETPIVWLMIPSHVVQSEVAEWLAILPTGSVIIDGGNSNFHQTIIRANLARTKGITYLDVGTSGGIRGLTNGFSLMIGGERAGFEAIKPLCNVLCAPNGGYVYAGPSGAGHYVKMIHNGIEYGMMQSLAEGYHLLKEGKDFPGLNVAGIAETWQHGSIVASQLNNLVGELLEANPELDGVSGFVDATGEADWTLEVAEKQGIHMPALQAALHVRHKSRSGNVSYTTKLLAALRNAFGGHPINK